MSKAKTAFETSIADAVHVLAQFDGLQKPPAENADVLFVDATDKALVEE